MGQVGYNKAVNDILLFLVIAFSSFEYFFRSNTPMIFLSISVILFFSKKYKLYTNFLLTCIVFYFILLLQVAFISEYSINRVFANVIYLIAYYVIAYIIGKDFMRSYLSVMSIITISSVFIFVISQIPSVNTFLVNTICPMFPSLNNEIAIQDGGGLNFIIYNFQTNHTAYDLFLGLNLRNCGPFWEPGMFAVYLNLALFFNLFFNNNRRYYTVLFIVGLLSTFSTGGYMGFLFILFCYFLHLSFGGGSIFTIILLIVISIPILNYFSEADFLGMKLVSQMENATLGSDSSRFGAMLTQLVMIKDSPLIGGMLISDYANSRTLASGTLFPLVYWGIPVGIIYYYLLYNSCIVYSKLYNSTRGVGLFMFLTLLFISFSQTILLMPFFYVIAFNSFFARYFQSESIS